MGNGVPLKTTAIIDVNVWFGFKYSYRATMEVGLPSGYMILDQICTFKIAGNECIVP